MFYERAKARAQKADMIITNHALLLTDETNQRIHTGDADMFIIDEAHHLSARRASSMELEQTMSFSTKIDEARHPQAEGYFEKAERLYRSAGISSESFSKWTNGSLSFLKKAIYSLRLFILCQEEETKKRSKPSLI
ncbi:hypothetical protein PO124_15820 [Bacillus licheniformis]|nr:hypothetical protein [Bacillus licheniformis]